ncbi:MAG: hypothetical protein AAB486_03935 [Patescibacteria group bacterium]
MGLFKQFLSLVIPQVIYETSSPISGEIKVVQQMGQRSLYVGGLVQSVTGGTRGLSKRIWGRLVEEALSAAHTNGIEIKNVLLLGLGGGTMAERLQKAIGPVPIDAVEIDQAIVHAARDYFDLSAIANLRVVVGDATFVVTHPENFTLSFPDYSLIIVDLYLGATYPLGAGTAEFFRGLNNLLAAEGLVVFNRVSLDPDFASKLSGCFNNIRTIEVTARGGGQNYLFLGNKKL